MMQRVRPRRFRAKASSVVTLLALGSLAAVATIADARAGGEPTVIGNHGALVAAVTFSPDGKAVFTGGWRHVVREWDVDGRREGRVLHGPEGYVVGLAVSPDGATLAAGAQDRSVRRWSLATGKPLPGVERLSGNGPGVRFSPDGKLLAGTDYRGVHLWDAATLKEVRWLADPGERADVQGLAFSGEGRRLAAVVSHGDDAGVRVWEVAAGKLLADVRPPKGHTPWAADLSPDGATLLVAHARLLRATDVASGRVVFEYDPAERDGSFALPGGILCTRFSPDGKLALAAGGGLTLHVWETRGWTEVARFPRLNGRPGERDAADYVSAAAFSIDGRRVAAGASDGTIYLWVLPSLQAGRNPQAGRHDEPPIPVR